MRCEQPWGDGILRPGKLSTDFKSSGARSQRFVWIQAEFPSNWKRILVSDRFGHSHFCRTTRGSIARSSRNARRIFVASSGSGSGNSSFSSAKRRLIARGLEWRIHAKRPRRESWWKKLLLDDFDWWREHNDEAAMDEIGRMMLDDEEIKSWKQRVDAINELRWYRKRGRDPGSDNWEDWLDGESWEKSRDKEVSSRGEVDEIEQELLHKKEEELKYLRSELDSFGKARKATGPFSDLFQEPLEWHQENKFERGFARSAARSTVKFAACLILIPWLADFVVHDCVLVPFLKRYVELVPFAARAFDVTDSQMTKRVVPPLEDEEKRLMFEVRIGIAPPISEEKLTQHLHDEALELVEEVRAENRSNFASVWSDVAGVVLMLLIILNPVQVELMSYSGIRLFSNLSDIGKAFFIILFSDIFLGYHSESGWVTVVNLFLEHYGMKANEASISSFVAIVPVTIDACFKLWVFRNLPRLSPSLTAIFREMERH
ncbi:chloroplast envelope membrane protein-like [Selaginella moellendorffii]|uniref:chloroplast envelope membrane protein-like n=1 Tax=Selaginella moellendorffii TaxID=88036 RepID=UPI000D1C65DB|nr:chloroplast envelope membrane protein-like [Selaginella moellendorffii]|eukprot:XP_024532836.1 chloroplast envelope membrane protein-like [Selaginella moellendorffii]